MNQGFQAMEQASKHRALHGAHFNEMLAQTPQHKVLGGEQVNLSKAPELRRVIDELHMRIGVMGDLIQTLSSRLSPVCNPRTASSAQSPQEPTAYTAVGADIAGAALRVRVLSEQLSELIESLEV